MNLNYPQQLPITACKDEIIEAIQQNRVIVIAGDTGSGKTTQLPKMCLEAGQGKKAMIGCTQPRRIAAVSVAERVAEEMDSQDLVGYKIRFHDHTRDTTRIKFMTDGILLAESKNDRNLRSYDTIIVDEAHERSLNIDFLLGYLHQLLESRDDLKIIISSATIDTEKFSSHFHKAPIIEVSGRTYPVTVQYEPIEDESDDDQVEHAVKWVESVVQKPGGDILVFMPTERDILDTVAQLRKRLIHPAKVLPLFGRLQGSDQRKIFQSSGLRKIIVATNVAETSITVPGIETVIDTGLARISHYNVRSGITSLPISRISRASCEQRAGRCGRTGPGTCIRLYSEEDFDNRSSFTLPEILRSNLAEVILQMISLGLSDPRKFPFLEMPAPRAINDGYRILNEMGAITRENHLTKRGRIMARLPMDPRISRMLLQGAELGALRETAIIAAVLAIQDPRIRPADKIEQARQAHAQFTHPGSDVLTLVNLWDACKKSMSGRQPAAGLRKFCKSSYCSWQRMREWFDIHEQIMGILKRHTKFSINSEPAQPTAVHQALTAGFLRNIGMCKKSKNKNIYQISGNREAVIFPGSSLHNKGGLWIVAADFVQTSQLFARVVANIEVEWLEELGGSLCKRSWSDPVWRKKSGQIMALEKVTLFGLLIVANRRVNYGRINEETGQEARQIFIREALIEGQCGGSYPFLQHNLALARRFAEMEERLRKRTIMMDDKVLYDFYDQRLPLVYDRFTLNQFLAESKSKQASNKDRFLWMCEEDICKAMPDSDELYRFPETLQTNQGGLQLSYLFQPGDDKDGVTVTVPVSCYPSLSPELFEWLVPGLLEEKIFQLLKGLPKRLRKLFVPLPDTVDRILDGLDMYQGSLYPAMERIILRSFQVTITRADWQTSNLPVHLRMRFQLCDDRGRVLYCSRIFRELEPYCTHSVISPGNKLEKSKIPEEKTITSWDFNAAPQPQPLTDKQGRITGMVYPALFLNSKEREGQAGLTLKYINDPQQAGQQNRLGLRHLFCRQFSQEIKQVKKECKRAVAGHTGSWLSLGMKAGAAEIQELLLHSIVDNLFCITTELPNREAVEATVHEIKKQSLSRPARIYLDQLLDLLTTRRLVQVTLTQHRQRGQKNRSFDQGRFDDFQKLLNELLPSDFLTCLSSQKPINTKRYLLALEKRIERAEHAPHKDLHKQKRLQPFLEQLSQLKQKKVRSHTCQEEISCYKTMVEEFRVSIFAPEIGTSLPVSEKRLKEQWQMLENSCQSVE